MTDTFLSLGVPKALAKSLESQGISEPFPIQTKTLPDSLRGRDVLGRGRTGSGKTLAFSLPLVARLSELEAAARRKPRRPLGLVLAPTRELATQINNTVEPLAAAFNMTTTVIYGGVSQQRQERVLNAGVDIVIACPGRLEDLMRQKLISLAAVEITVLDEADHMADMGFLPTVKKILNTTPPEGQRLLFSATLDNGVDKIVKQYLHDPVTHSVDDAVATVSTMEHHVLSVADQPAKKNLIVQLASGKGKRVLFTRTKHHAKKLAKTLTDVGIPAVDLHGNLSQNARDRNLAEFSNGNVRVLVATDVAARGVHVDEVELVIHVDPPTEHKAYLHRSGRTARAGSAGTVVTIMTPEQNSDVKKLMRAAGVDVAFQKVDGSSALVAELVGEVADKIDPRTRAALTATRTQPRSSAPGTRTRSPRGRGPNRERAERSPRSGETRTGETRTHSPRDGATPTRNSRKPVTAQRNSATGSTTRETRSGDDSRRSTSERFDTPRTGTRRTTSTRTDSPRGTATRRAPQTGNSQTNSNQHRNRAR